jgi:hypothetical protein
MCFSVEKFTESKERKLIWNNTFRSCTIKSTSQHGKLWIHRCLWNHDVSDCLQFTHFIAFLWLLIELWWCRLVPHPQQTPLHMAAARGASPIKLWPLYPLQARCICLLPGSLGRCILDKPPEIANASKVLPLTTHGVKQFPATSFRGWIQASCRLPSRILRRWSGMVLCSVTSVLYIGSWRLTRSWPPEPSLCLCRRYFHILSQSANCKDSLAQSTFITVSCQRLPGSSSHSLTCSLVVPRVQTSDPGCHTVVSLHGGQTGPGSSILLGSS